MEGTEKAKTGGKYTREDIIRRVQGLLDNAESKKVANEVEAANFLLAAQRLMQKHNIEQAELRKKDTSKKLEVTMKIVTMQSHRSWSRILLDSLANACFCKAVFFNKRGQTNKATLFGEASNIDGAMAMYTYLVKELLRISKKKYDEYMLTAKNPISPLTWYNNFLQGAADSIDQRLRDQFNNPEDREQTKALVVVHEQAINLMMQQYYPKLGTMKTRVPKTQQGYHEGRVTGMNMPLHQEIER